MHKLTIRRDYLGETIQKWEFDKRARYRSSLEKAWQLERQRSFANLSGEEEGEKEKRRRRRERVERNGWKKGERENFFNRKPGLCFGTRREFGGVKYLKLYISRQLMIRAHELPGRDMDIINRAYYECHGL